MFIVTSLILKIPLLFIVTDVVSFIIVPTPIIDTEIFSFIVICAFLVIVPPFVSNIAFLLNAAVDVSVLLEITFITLLVVVTAAIASCKVA